MDKNQNTEEEVKNIQNEDVQKLDLIANDIFINKFKF